MKKNWFMKCSVVAVFVALLASSCSVTYRERHRHYRDRDRVIIRP